ncbi:MAG: Flp family type IVb pilin [Bacillota bacterium]
MLKRLWKEESGQGMAEYGLILALVAVVCIGAFVVLGNGINNKVNKVADELKN